MTYLGKSHHTHTNKWPRRLMFILLLCASFNLYATMVKVLTYSVIELLPKEGSLTTPPPSKDLLDDDITLTYLKGIYNISNIKALLQKYHYDVCKGVKEVRTCLEVRSKMAICLGNEFCTNQILASYGCSKGFEEMTRCPFISDSMLDYAGSRHSSVIFYLLTETLLHIKGQDTNVALKMISLVQDYPFYEKSIEHFDYIVDNDMCSPQRVNNINKAIVFINKLVNDKNVELYECYKGHPTNIQPLNNMKDQLINFYGSWRRGNFVDCSFGHSIDIEISCLNMIFKRLNYIILPYYQNFKSISHIPFSIKVPHYFKMIYLRALLWNLPSNMDLTSFSLETLSSLVLANKVLTKDQLDQL